VEKTQFLFIEDCSSTEQTWNDLVDCLNKLGINLLPERVIIHDDLEAEFHCFQGSPSIKVDGVDLWKREQVEFHMGYRSYTTPDGLSDRPTKEMLSDQLNLHIHTVS